MKSIGEVFNSDELDIDFDYGTNSVLESSFYKKDFSSDVNYQNRYHWIHFESIIIDGLEFKFSVCLEDNRLNILTFALIAEEFGFSWCEWTEEKELKRKEAHEELLKELFNLSTNEDPSDFKVDGLKIDSLYDSKGASSYVVIKKI